MTRVAELMHTHRKTITAIRWLARATSLLSVVLLGLFFFDGSLSAQALAHGTWLGLLCFPVGVAGGLVLAWWRERPGAVMAACSLLAFYAWHWSARGTLPHGFAFIAFTLPAVGFWLAALGGARSDRDG